MPQTGCIDTDLRGCASEKRRNVELPILALSAVALSIGLVGKMRFTACLVQPLRLEVAGFQRVLPTFGQYA